MPHYGGGEAVNLPTMSPAAGAPWPGAEHGEVHSPSGQRAYLAANAARLAGRSKRWATDLALKGEDIATERGTIAGRQGGPQWFLIADSLETYLRQHNLWPPTSTPAQEWQHLAQLQEADLEAARQELTELKDRVAEQDQRITELTDLVRQLDQDRKKLIRTVRTLSEIAETPTPNL